MPVDEMLFLIEHNLCQLYGGLTPFVVQCESYHNVIMLYADVRRMQIREDRKPKGKDGKKIIRRHASDNAGWW